MAWNNHLLQGFSEQKSMSMHKDEVFKNIEPQHIYYKMWANYRSYVFL